MVLSDKQKEFIKNANKRFNLKVGARRCGKSFLDVLFRIPKKTRELSGKDGLFVILGVSKGTIERNVLQPMREIYGSKLIGNINTNNIAILFGEEYYCLGAEKVSQVSKIQGTSIKYCYCDELAKFSKEVFEMVKGSLDKSYSCLDGALNPEHEGHPLKVDFLDKIEEEGLDVYVQTYTIFDNPFLPEDFVENFCKEMKAAGTHWYNRLVLGQWCDVSGLVFSSFEKELNVINKLPDLEDFQSFDISMDYGIQNATAALLWGNLPNGTSIALKEYFHSGRETGVQKTDAEYVVEIERLANILPDKLKRKFKHVIIDPSAASMIAAIRTTTRLGVRKANNQVLEGIANTNLCLANNKLLFYKDCKETIAEFGKYKWSDKAGEKDSVVKEHDHCITGDTIINTSYGDYPIKDLVGKSWEVLSYNEKTCKAEYKTFFDVRKTREDAEIYRVEFENGKFVDCTPDHLILTTEGWKECKDLTTSDNVIDVICDYSKVKSITKLNNQDVFNMEVADNHNFSVNGGIIIHNCMDACRYKVQTDKMYK